MKKFTAFAFALLTLVPFVIIAWLLYTYFHNTPIVIVNLLIIMTGVMLGLIVFNRLMVGNNHNYIKANTTHYPHIEGALIYVMPSDFVSKLEKKSGKLFLATTDEVEKNITLVNGEYNKLTDEISLFYTQGISTTIRGARTIAVGDYQFLLYGFEELVHQKGKGKTIFQWEKDRLVQKNGKELISIKIPNQSPVYIFDWK